MNGSYYAVIPAKVLHDKDLLKYPKSILLYGHIANLANQKGYCWATNKYFMEQLGVKSATTITDYLNLLVRKGFINKKNIYKKGTKQIDKRVISIDTGTPISVDCNTPTTADCNSPISAHCKENNTRINSTSINNSSYTGTGNSNSAFELYQIHVGMLSGKQTPIFVDYIQKLGDEVVQFAINLMLDQTSRPNFNYLQRILMKYEGLEVTSVEKAKEIEEQFKNKRQSSSNYNKRPQFEEKMPSWMKSTEPLAKSEDDNKNSQKNIKDLMDKINKKTEKNKATKASEE